MTTQPKQGTSFARIIITPLILLVTGQTLACVAVAAVVATGYILVASRR